MTFRHVAYILTGKPWYLANDMSMDCVIGAWEPCNAPDLAGSYNSINPNNALAMTVPSGGTAPAFAKGTGWTFGAATSDRLTCASITPVATTSMILRCSGFTSRTAQSYFAGAVAASGNGAYWIGSDTTLQARSRVAYCTNESVTQAEGWITSGVLGILGSTMPMLGGISCRMASAFTTPFGVSSQIYVGNGQNSATFRAVISIQAIAFYNIPLNASQYLEIAQKVSQR